MSPVPGDGPPIEMLRLAVAPCAVAPWLASRAVAQRLDVEACANSSAGDECAFAGALNTVRQGTCADVGPVNNTAVTCIPGLSAGELVVGERGAPDPFCTRGHLNSRLRVCCPRACGDCVEVYDAAADCSVEFILRVGLRCAEAAPPCIVDARQGRTSASAGFLGASPSTGSKQGVQPAGQMSPEATAALKSLETSDSTDARLTDLPTPVVVALVASTSCLCLCILCGSLIWRLLLTPEDDQAEVARAAAQGTGLDTMVPGKRHKKRKRPPAIDTFQVDSDNAAADAEDMSLTEADADDSYGKGVDDGPTLDGDAWALGLYSQCEVPMPIIDVWGESAIDQEEEQPNILPWVDPAPAPSDALATPQPELLGAGVGLELLSQSKQRGSQHRRGGREAAESTDGVERDEEVDLDVEVLSSILGSVVEESSARRQDAEDGRARRREAANEHADAEHTSHNSRLGSKKPRRSRQSDSQDSHGEVAGVLLRDERSSGADNTAAGDCPPSAGSTPSSGVRDQAWHRKWDDMQADLSSALEDGDGATIRPRDVPLCTSERPRRGLPPRRSDDMKRFDKKSADKKSTDKKSADKKNADKRRSR